MGRGASHTPALPRTLPCSPFGGGYRLLGRVAWESRGGLRPWRQPIPPTAHRRVAAYPTQSLGQVPTSETVLVVAGRTRPLTHTPLTSL